MKKLVLLVGLFTLMSTLTLSSQVTIGANETPDPSAVLDLRSVNKGLLIPRLTLGQRKTITDPANGLIIYNVEEKCYNYYDGAKGDWISLCGGASAAKFKMECASIVAHGAYVIGAPMTAANYLSVPIHVTQEGSFAISGTSNNGYSFYYSGTVTDTGQYVINVPALGMPSKEQIDNVMVISAADTCSIPVTVQTNVATYDIDCASIVVYGNYLKNQVLDKNNYIEIRVNVSSAGSCNISTPIVNGISFSASYTLGVGSTTIRLFGSGTPTTNSDFPITITTNSPAGNVTCSATIPMTLPPLTYALIGNDGTFSWTGTGSRLPALQNGASFGENGTVKIVSLTQKWSTNNAATAATNLSTMIPDIVLYFAYNAPVSSDLIAALKNYVEKGGVLIYAPSSSDLTSAQQLVSGLFPGFTPQAMPNCNSGACPSSYPNDDNCYTINNIPGDPVVYGPFGNLSGKKWAEDNETTGTFYLPSLPAGAVQICSAQNNWGHTNLNPDWSVVWYSNSMNFFYFGDTNGASSSDISNGGYPSYWSSAGVPLTKQYGNGDNANSPFVYVSALELNAVAWACHKAAIAGINPH